jgi:hypothetical protein
MLYRVLWKQVKDMASKARVINIFEVQHGGAGLSLVRPQDSSLEIGLIRNTVVVGEVANFAAYAFAPAILVTPLGALSVLIG